MGGETFAAVAAGKDAEVADAKLLQAVEFAGETLAVASASFRGKYGAIPEVGAYVAVGRVTDVELSVTDCHKCGVGLGRGR